jgi:aspartate racemase
MMAPRTQVAVPGILGGLGPLAHIELERHLLEESVRRGARRDADHPVWIVINATDVPDRTLSLARRAPACTPWLVRYGNRLGDAGADFIVVPCNTAHAFYDQVRPELRVPWLHLIDETARHIARTSPRTRRVGVIATDGTLAAGLYERSLRSHDLDVLAFAPGSDEQRRVMQAIYDPAWGVKAGGARLDARVHHALAAARQALIDRGAELVVAACTELSVAIAGAPPAPVPWLDPLRVLAAKVLDLAFAEPAHPAPPSSLAPTRSPKEVTR